MHGRAGAARGPLGSTSSSRASQSPGIAISACSRGQMAESSAFSAFSKIGVRAKSDAHCAVRISPRSAYENSPMTARSLKMRRLG